MEGRIFAAAAQRMGFHCHFTPIVLILALMPVSLAWMLVLTEAGKYGIMRYFLHIYLRIRPDFVRDQFIRGEVLGYICANPGCHYALIKQDLDLHHTILILHLDSLERDGLIRPSRDGALLRFFPSERRIPRGGFQPSPIQESMVRYIESKPGARQADISRELFIDMNIVGYNINLLRGVGILRIGSDGGLTRVIYDRQ